MKDLFECYELMPANLKVICDKWAEYDGLSYKEIDKFHDEVYAIGYTFDYGLDGVPFGLRPIGTPIEEIYPEIY